MALTKASTLFAWDARYGPSPALGGDPVYVRDSAAWWWDGRRFRKSITAPSGETAPRFDQVVVDGVPRRALVTEPAATHRLSDPADFQSGGAWLQNGTWGLADAASIIEGGVATRHTGDGVTSSQRRSQSRGTAPGGKATFRVIIENINSAVTQWGILSGGVWKPLGRFTWATRLADTTSGTGTVRATLLMEVGPNGGPVYALDCTGDITAGNAPAAYVYPHGLSALGTSAVLHYAGSVVELARISYPGRSASGASSSTS